MLPTGRVQVIFNLGAGVDAVMADKTLPAVPLVRVANKTFRFGNLRRGHFLRNTITILGDHVA